MAICNYIEALVDYGVGKALISEGDRIFIRNRILKILNINEFALQAENFILFESVEKLLEKLCDYAAQKGLIEDTIAERDILDTEIMGAFTAMPSIVAERFFKLYENDKISATDWFYEYAQDTNYIRRERIARDMKWKTPTPYGDMHITINLSKPEKDPRDIAKAKQSKCSKGFILNACFVRKMRAIEEIPCTRRGRTFTLYRLK